MIIWAVLFFLLAVILFPPTWIADIMLAALRGDLPDPPLYLAFSLHFCALEFVGVFVTSRRFCLMLASYVLGVGLTWSLVVRRFLET